MIWGHRLGAALALAVIPPLPGRADELKPIAPIERTLPPKGITIPPEAARRLREKLVSLEAQVPPIESRRQVYEQGTDGGDWADAKIFLKAVDFALINGEFYKPGDVGKADALLVEAENRIQALKQGRAPWARATGLVVRGFISDIDGSWQPYGVEVPDKFEVLVPASGPPAYVWLHGRADQATDLHFIHERMHKKGQFQNNKGIVIHPFGRHCLGYKSAGEVDVLEALADAGRKYPIDPQKVALMGFSMGGAGAWHLGAHYPDMWAVVHAGAGFVDVRRYQKIDPATRPPWEVQLWGLYDVPDYRRNFFNLPFIVYSGELDKQKASADIMEEELRREGIELRRVIGKGAGHKYTPEAQREIHQFIDEKLSPDSRNDYPLRIQWQTRTLRYPGFKQLTLLALEKHWEDARVDAEWTASELRVTTRNVASLRYDAYPATNSFFGGSQVLVDETNLPLPARGGLVVTKEKGQWKVGSSERGKRTGLQGPIDDVFMTPFIVVTPSGTCRHPLVERWVRFELAHFEKRWRETFRGRLRMKKDTEVTDDDVAKFSLILWGDSQSNSLIRRFEPALPITTDEAAISVGAQSFDASRHVATFIYPRRDPALEKFGFTTGIPFPPLYLVINSGPTFREAHDKTNSQQNPKLPDWAVIDLSQDPDATAPGRVAAAGFFHEEWQLE